MYDFSFICRASKSDRNGQSPIELSIIVNGKRTYVALPLKVTAGEFKKKMASKRNNEVLEYTSNIRRLLTKYSSEMLSKGISVTATSLKEYFKNGGVYSYMLSALVDEFLSYYHNKVDAGAATAKVYRKYELALNNFASFVGDIEVHSVNCIHIENFKLELSKTYEPTTVSHILGKVKSAFIYAVNNGKLRINPFNQITIGKTAKEVEKLDNDEVEVIKRKKFVGRLDKVRDLFLFQCYTALSYADMANLVQGDIQYKNEMHFIRKPRQKTGIVFFTVLNDDAMEILKKYDYQLPVLSNQKYNSYLKEIGDVCNINKPLHSHLARHTAATKLLNDGMPLEIVAKVLGHTNTRQTAHYAKLLDTTILEAFKKIG